MAKVLEQSRKNMNNEDLLFEDVFGFFDATFQTTLSNFENCSNN